MNVVENIDRLEREAAGPVVTANTYAPVRAPGDVVLIVGEAELPALGFTAGGLVVAGQVDRRERDGTIRFRFATFEVSRDVRLGAVRDLTADLDAPGSVEVTVEQDQQIASIIVAYLREPEILPGALLRDAAARQATSAPSPDGRTGLSRIYRKERHRMLAALIAVGAIAVFAWTGYHRVFMVDASGFVTARDVDLIRAEHGGVFYAYGASGNRLMHRDELIGLLETRNGKPVSITAPCTCYLGDAAVDSGSTVGKGTVVARVIRPEAKVEITAHMPLSRLWAVNVGDTVELRLPGAADPIAGKITAIERDKIAAVATTNDSAAATPGIVRIEPTTEIDKSLVGSEVPIRLVRATAMFAGLLAR